MPAYSMIVAYDANRLIGRENDLPWRLSADLQYFKRMTMGKPLLMGRKTYDSIGRPLPGREMLVLSRDTQLQIAGCRVIHDQAELNQLYADDQEVMVAGGAQVYQLFLPVATTLYVTRVQAELSGDAYFPTYADAWDLVAEESYAADEKNEYAYAFQVYKRR